MPGISCDTEAASAEGLPLYFARRLLVTGNHTCLLFHALETRYGIARVGLPVSYVMRVHFEGSLHLTTQLTEYVDSASGISLVNFRICAKPIFLCKQCQNVIAGVWHWQFCHEKNNLTCPSENDV